MKKHPRNPTVGGEERIQKDGQLWKRNFGKYTDTVLVQCGVCKGKFKEKGLKIHVWKILKSQSKWSDLSSEHCLIKIRFLYLFDSNV